ncbi:MAG: N-acetyl-gamma-glutamyl-phosphate reductase [Phycisphaerales bacterium]|nr:N-acetyl-gamma-glutamyl-phosphate reductase [Phycisphaerales bacterium]
MSDRPIRAAILGATGYGAGELLRLLVAHPLVDVVGASSTSLRAAPIAVAHPHLAGFYDDLTIEDAIDWAKLRNAKEAVLFSALPHDASPAAIEQALVSAEKAGVRPRVIDLSGALRLRDATIHARHYPETPFADDLRGGFTYGMPEIDRAAVRSARHITNPGCLATASILAVAPLAFACRYSGEIAVDARTGSSGSGKGLKDATHHPTRHADFRAYKPMAHQHEPEILQALGDANGERIALSFVPHSLPVSRGIFVTAHATLPDEMTTTALREAYRRYYAESPFIRLRDDSPTLQDVVGSNFCDIAVFARARQVVAMSTIDNLVKGMAGAAIQNMNLMCGHDERLGLWTPALRPV